MCTSGGWKWSVFSNDSLSEWPFECLDALLTKERLIRMN